LIFKYKSIMSLLIISIISSGYSVGSDSSLKTEGTARPVKHVEGFSASGDDSSDAEEEGPRAPLRLQSRSKKITEQLLEKRRQRRSKSGVRSSIKSQSDSGESVSDSDYAESDSEETFRALKIENKKADEVKLITKKPGESLLPVLDEDDEEWV